MTHPACLRSRWTEGGIIAIAEARRPLHALPDEVLAGSPRSDLHAFTELYIRYQNPIRRYLAARVGDDAAAEDLSAQVFLKALANGGSFRGEGSYRSWLFQIARNTLASWRSEKARLQIPVDALPERSDGTDVPTDVALAEEEREILWNAVADLPHAQREVVQLRYWKDLTIDEIARHTGRTTGAIRVLLHRAKRSIAERITKKEMTVLLGATGAASIALYSAHRQKRQR